MATQTEVKLSSSEAQKTSARDRLLAALSLAPRLSSEDAERINSVVQAARENSIADGLPD